MKAQGFSFSGIGGDLSAGLTKAIDSVTGGMANAVLAGVNPVYGLYTVLAATPVGALFTSSVYMNIDSTGAIAATAGSMLLIYSTEERPMALAVLTLLVGLLMLAAGLLKLGFLTRFIANAVLRGFLTGIGVNIILGQLGDFTGYASEYENKVVKAVDTLLNLNQVDLQVLLVGVVAVVLIVVLDRVPYINKFSLLIALTVASALVPLLGLTTVPLVSSLGELPDKLPRPVLPDLTFIPELIGPAIALTIIALAQSAGISQAYANPDGKYPDTSRDFLGQGAANLAGSLVQGLPAGGSLSGTALLVKGGAHSRWANIFTGLMAAIIILVFGDFIGKIALSALAGLLMVVGFQTINFREIAKIRHTSTASRAVMVATFYRHVDRASAMGHLLRRGFVFCGLRYSRGSQHIDCRGVAECRRHRHRADGAGRPGKQSSHCAECLWQPLLCRARNLEEDLPQAAETHNAVVILSLRGHTEVGSTFIGVLERYIQALRANGNTLMLVGVNPAVYEQLAETQFLVVLGAENVFVASKPGESTLQAYEKAQQLIKAGNTQTQTALEVAP